MNNYGIIICDKSRNDSAGSTGRSLLNSITQTWERHCFLSNETETVDSVKTGKLCDGSFTGHFLILVHGNYNETNTKGHLYLEEPEIKYTEATQRILKFVNEYPLQEGIEKKVYIFACGQGRETILNWYRSQNGFNTQNVWCPCTTAMMGGAINVDDIRSKMRLER